MKYPEDAILDELAAETAAGMPKRKKYLASLAAKTNPGKVVEDERATSAQSTQTAENISKQVELAQPIEKSVTPVVGSLTSEQSIIFNRLGERGKRAFLANLVLESKSKVDNS